MAALKNPELRAKARAYLATVDADMARELYRELEDRRYEARKAAKKSTNDESA